MSSKNYVLTNEKKRVLMGHTYDGKEVMKFSTSLHENHTTTFANPLTCRTGGQVRVDMNIRTENYNLNELLFEFDHVNTDATLSQTVLNPYLFFQEIKVFFNDQQVVHYDNAEEIFCTVADNVKRYNKDEFVSLLQTTMVNNFSTPLTGETVAAGQTRKWSLPFTTFIMPWLRDISPTDVVGKLSLEVKFVANYGTAASIGRFMLSSTTNNPYTDSTIRFDNIQVRHVFTRHRDPYLMRVPNPLIPIQRFAEKQYSLSSWNATTDTQRIQLSQDFSHYRNCNLIYVYLYPSSNVTAYNDSDCMKVNSGLGLIGWELRWKSRTIVNFSQSTDNNRKAKYYHDTYYKKHGKVMDDAMISDNTDKSKCWIPLTMIDLQSVGNGSNDDDRLVFSGIANQNSDLELILYNTQGAYCAGTCLLNVVLGYTEFFNLDSKTGVVREIQA